MHLSNHSAVDFTHSWKNYHEIDNVSINLQQPKPSVLKYSSTDRYLQRRTKSPLHWKHEVAERLYILHLLSPERLSQKREWKSILLGYMLACRTTPGAKSSYRLKYNLTRVYSASNLPNHEYPSIPTSNTATRMLIPHSLQDWYEVWYDSYCTEESHSNNMPQMNLKCTNISPRWKCNAEIRNSHFDATWYDRSDRFRNEDCKENKLFKIFTRSWRWNRKGVKSYCTLHWHASASLYRNQDPIGDCGIIFTSIKSVYDTYRLLRVRNPRKASCQGMTASMP